MSLFMIETGDVSSVASSMASIASELNSLASTVSGYDTACEEFNFSGPKATIAANIQACATKVTNTGALMNEVVSAHTALQGSLSFDGSTSTTTDAPPAGTTADTPTDIGSPTTGGTTTGVTTTGGTTASVVGGTTAVTYATTSTPPAQVTYTEQPVYQQKPEPEQPQPQQPGQPQPSQPQPSQPEQPQPEQPQPQQPQPEQPQPQQPEQPHPPYTEIATGIGEAAAVAPGLATGDYQGPQNGFSQVGGLGTVGYVGDTVQPLEVVKDPFLKYNDVGFAVIDDAYVISCPSEYGKVGDELIFTLKDGNTIKCVIGEIKSDPNDLQFTFFTNNSFNVDSPDNFTSNLIDNLTEVKNTGQSPVIVRSKIAKAVSLTIQTSQSSQGMVIPDNKLSYIVSSYDKAGIPINLSAYKKDGNIKDVMTRSGFIYQDGAPDPKDLMPGDILVTKDGNVLMYVKEDKVVVDYTTYEHTIDDSGNEIPVIKDDKYTVAGVYRFAPNDLLEQQNKIQVEMNPQQGTNQLGPNGEQPSQLGPNGEQPGQLGPNGEQPPSGPPTTGGNGMEELPRDSYDWDESAY